MDIPKLPKLDRLPMRSSSEIEDKEIWTPSWNCYCCEDSGLVKSSLVKLVIPDFNFDRDKLPLCQNDGCYKSDYFETELLSGCLDRRLTPDICRTLDHIARADWKETIEQRRRGLPGKKRSARSEVSSEQGGTKQIDFSEVVKSLRKRSRTSEEEFLSQRRHADEKNR
ncbi:MAG: hypothetical protein QNJ54_06605 [Prochloraceae cyanobacterium]|nr:hypothetical protein [Prochloraceae cyanobacterium]